MSLHQEKIKLELELLRLQAMGVKLYEAPWLEGQQYKARDKLGRFADVGGETGATGAVELPEVSVDKFNFSIDTNKDHLIKPFVNKQEREELLGKNDRELPTLT